MSEQFITRYRPTEWEHVVGNSAIVASLKSKVQYKDAQNFLFGGDPGMGKTTMAKLLTHYLNCQEIIERDAGRLGGVDEMRDLLDAINYQPLTEGNRGITINECFAAGTRVLTTKGYKNIEQIDQSDYVISAKGPSRVRQRFANKISVANVVHVSISSGKTITCTADHLFLTNMGWVEAGKLHAGAKLVEIIQGRASLEPAMLDVWDNVHLEKSQSKRMRWLPGQGMPRMLRKIHGLQNHLFPLVRQRAGGQEETGTALSRTKSPSEGGHLSREKTRSREMAGALRSDFQTYVEKEPESQPLYSYEGEGYERIEGNFACMVGKKRGYGTNHPATGSALESVELPHGIHHQDLLAEKGIPEKIPSRFSLSGQKIGHRDRRSPAPLESTKATRSAKDKTSGEIRVVGVEVHKSRSGQGFTSSGEAHSGHGREFTTFYDLEVEEHPSYCVEGVIVHNCHELSAKAWNTILVTLEEPKPFNFWFFTTSVPRKVPDAIKRRCASYQLKPTSDKELTGLLQEIVELEKADPIEDVVPLCVKAASGSPAMALAYLSKTMDCQSVEEIRELLQEPLAVTDHADIAKALVQGADWGRMRALLSGLEESRIESVRYVVLHIISRIVMGEGGANQRLFDILEVFSTPFPSGEGLAPLIVALRKCGVR